mgnify:CR=1 FL=1
MNEDLGPLAPLVGTWTGNKGKDLSPEPSGSEETEYRETLSFEVVGSVLNAEKQELRVLRYLQRVFAREEGTCIHDETGYWMWEPKTNRVLKSTAIPRGVVALMEGEWLKDDNAQSIQLKLLSPEHESVVQPTWMKENAKTVSMTQSWSLDSQGLAYDQLTVLDIYGKTFEHTDSNKLTKS